MKKTSSIRFKMPLTISIITTILLIITIIILSYKSYIGITKSTYAGYNNTIEGYKAMLDTWFEENNTLIKTYSITPSIINYLSGTQTPEEASVLIDALKQFEAINKYSLDIGVTDVNGITLQNTKNINLGVNIKDLRPGIWDNFVKNNYDFAYDTKVLKSTVSDNMTLAIIAGVRTNNVLVGAVYMILNWDVLGTKLSELQLPETGRVFAIDTQRNILLDTRNQINTSANQSYDNVIKENKDSGTLIYISDTNGEKRTAVYTKMKTMPWILSMAADDNIIYAENISMIRIAIIVCILSVIFVNLFSVSYITKTMSPLSVLMKKANRISEGNIELKSSANYRKDEFGELEKAFNVMSQKLAEVVSNVNDASNEIVLASQRMMESSVELSSRTDSQASSLEETASSLEEIVSTIKASADNSVSGKNMMSQSMENIEGAANIIAQTVSNIEEVHQASDKIKDITKIIEDIAFQTNILALNASVEAARAGTQGKGFAVVASEVRNLAQTTQSSVKDITSLVDNTAEKIDTATNTARESQEIFVQLQEKVSGTSELMQSITSTSLEQQAGVSQISIAINSIESATTQNAALAEESSELSKRLFDKAKFLEESIKFFNIS
ncbi:methyl-accepting chemotaxis protein [Brachyspira hyodysenteriae]|uniref:methyl-accepting chemotaxis protein n=1 Tax=Brachyspira hyodysenteriae TaxID=159 RepID=UPI0022CD2FE3|nr:methyl-accepting chemotaxis protein [Brachyspira hyodysenteriae]MCZ9839775.1 methyl-accepting chemotaxis protein [Brachyspira hyodysenteriae]MCZ9847417.1 methyl-accepting chemotaxis protein [Brachyspira hyodysenteriae]MCZ9850997.1 methyl-accepting chemotaxis protein [Brachyspira hyodysenteriae]MCZ9860250.1 methyl-accepting chemotaxis protein [Brachyspira hyodysenteriae]MCZ9873117.1 methyl-accepting chemotaxis protein [Brachyspira hyodysenteriae]